jgi:hypothetical protein
MADNTEEDSADLANSGTEQTPEQVEQEQQVPQGEQEAEVGKVELKVDEEEDNGKQVEEL